MNKPKLVPTSSSENRNLDALSKSKTSTDKETKVEPMTQREAVFVEITNILKAEKILMTSKLQVKDLLKEEHLKKIYTALIVGFKSGKISLKDTTSNKKKLNNDHKMEIYCMGLVNNWLKRDPRLNGKAK